ncbi:hypothetical protein DOY81_008197 [Sarcophaga bullata]|nr:hypothetical protein DOY81_008197 [Sarcophaga bullata]
MTVFCIAFLKNVCQSRWKTLRGRYVKKCGESYHASGSGAEFEENQWPYQQQMEFLREHIKPRSLTPTQPISKKKANQNRAGASYFTLLEDDLSQSIESLIDTSFLDEELTTSPTVSVPTLDTECSSCPVDVPHSSRRKPRREDDSEAFNAFLNKMSKIAETRFAVPSSQKESGPHEGFSSMVREIFNDFSSDIVKEAKFFH